MQKDLAESRTAGKRIIDELRKRIDDIEHRVCKASDAIMIRAEERLAAVEKSLVDMDHYIKGEMRTQIAQEIDLELRIRLNAYQGKCTQDALAAIIDPVSINSFRNMLFDLKRILESKKGRRWVQREIQRGVNGGTND